jgi:hypothetical protein
VPLARMHADQCFKPPSWHSYAFPRHFCVRVLRQSRPRKNEEGAGKAGRPLHPGALAPERLREGRVTTGTGGDTPAFPARWFDGLCVLLGEPSRLPPSPFAKLFSSARTWRQDLGARQDHTTSPYAISAARRSAHSCPSHPTARVVTFARRPSCRVGRKRPYARFYIPINRNIFCEKA